jgi:cytochrome b subunit of formate dehydrogenase
MPAYPFIALFTAQYIIYLAEYRTHIFRLFAGTLLTIASVVIVIVIIHLTGIVDFYLLIAGYISKQSSLEQANAIIQSLSPGIIQAFIYLFLLFAMGVLGFHLKKKINIKILYASILLVFCLNLLIDGVVMPKVRKYGSARPFVEEIQNDYPIDKTNVFVMNDLRNYGNLYGMNFYMKNCFRNFEIEQPQTGFFLSTEKDLPKIQQTYQGEYTFVILCKSNQIISDVRDKVVLCRFAK